MRRLFNGLIMSISMYTIVPVPRNRWDDSAANLVMAFFPCCGVIIGALWAGLYMLLRIAGLPMMLNAALLTALPFVLTGFIHLDGYMDTADAVLSRRPREEMQRILKDSHVGAFSVIVLVLLFIFDFASVYTLAEYSASPVYLIIIPVISRAFVGFCLLNVSPFSDDGYASAFQRGTRPIHSAAVLGFLFLAVALAVYCCGAAALAVVAVMLLTGGMVVRSVCGKLGGISGDLCGCVLTVCELCGIFAVAVIVS